MLRTAFDKIVSTTEDPTLQRDFRATKFHVSSKFGSECDVGDGTATASAPQHDDDNARQRNPSFCDLHRLTV